MDKNLENHNLLKHKESQDSQSYQEVKNSPENQTRPRKLPSFFKLLKEAFNIYRNKFWILVGLFFFPVLGLFLVAFLNIWLVKIFHTPLLSLILLPLIYLLAIVLMYWSVAAILYVIQSEGKVRFMLALKQSFPKIYQFFWISFLGNLVILGGLIPFIIPGFILAMALILATYIYIIENKKGMDALLRSSQMTRGFRWAIFWRYFLFIIIIMIILVPGAVLLSAISGDTGKIVSNIYTWLMTLFIMPLMLSFVYLIYKKLAEFSPAIQYQPSEKSRHLYIFLIIWGIVVTILPLVVTLINGYRALPMVTQ